MILCLLATLALGQEVLVVQTPGVSRGSYAPLVHALEQEGLEPRVVGFDCGSHDTAALVDQLVAAAGPEPVVVAHGLGATLALKAAPRLQGARFVLSAPVLGVLPQPGLLEAVQGDVGLSVVLSEARAAVLLGEPVPALGCVPVPFAAEVQSWVRSGAVPLDLAAVDEPVFMVLSLGDDVASVEATLPAARRLGGPRRVLRLGLSRLDPRDYEHIQLLVEPRVLRVLAREVRRPRWSRYLDPR